MSAKSGHGQVKRQSLPAPESVWNIADYLAMHALRSYILFPIERKVVVYFLLITCGSFVADFAKLSTKSSWARKESFLNVYFVKWSWAWNLALLGPFLWYTAQIYSLNNRRRVLNHCSRLVVGTTLWLWWTKAAFVHVEHLTGFCSKSSFDNRQNCLTNGGRWISFDISGHCFLLLYSCLLISEELAVFRNWDNLKRLLKSARGDDPPAHLAHVPSWRIEQTETLYHQHTPRIRFLFIALCTINIIWEFMLIITTLYHHSFAQKFAGTVIAILSWYLTYHVWYKRAASPGLPGSDVVHYQST